MFSRRDFAAGVAAVVAATPGLARGSAPSSSPAMALRHYLDPAINRRDFSGVVMLERSGAKPVLLSFGRADFERDLPHHADTAFMTASIGKLFTRAAVLGLERQGRLARSDFLARFLPDFPNAGAITIQHLIDHQAGVARDLPPATDLTRERTLEQLAALIAAQPMIAKPGVSGGYSNNGYRLLAKIVEVAGKGPYDDIVRELVFEPRKMRNTVSGVDLSQVRRRATGYRPAAGWDAIEPEPLKSLTNERGAGSFYSTAPDLMQFLRTLPLEPTDLESAARVDGEGKPKPRSVGHDGFGNGFANLAYAYPDENARMVLLGNIQSGLFTPLHADLRRILFGERVAPPDHPLPTRSSADDFDLLVGDYDLRPGNPLSIRRAATGLTVDGGDGAHPLVPLGGRRFFMRLRYATLAFDGASKQPATLIRWAEGGGDFSLKRLA